ncbi:DEAD/DEAH box helicase [Lichenibacterium dinghuense]|uniref:DEAD/DEAH box helicase n=1 Tax=Lichenibacterium dinghuense TaxID=2895977 RepID=UPI001F1BD519|nr:DEAD/DEAH box helicase [Lichenibacterium sp. 6Y81]
MAFPPTAPSLARALAERDYQDPTPVQSAVLEAEAGRDLLVSAQTGSGKTVAFGLAIAPTLMGDADALPPAAAPLALIVAPTRELALQVERELTWLYKPAGARIVSCVGGMDARREARALSFGVHIVVGTPGRLRDHLERCNLDPSALRAVVLDEADEMLDLGFRDDLEFILQTTPEERRTLLFSATLPKGIVTLAQRYQNDALRIAVAGGSRGHADIEYRAVRIVPREVEHAVVNLLRFYEPPSALVFANTRETVRHLQSALLERGFSTVSLSGELSQNERNHALQALRDGRARVCVATDVAARGIDLPGLALVIHADLPNDAETLQHRSGRTGRAGRKGVSVLLVPPARRRRAEGLLAVAKAEAAWSAPPTADEIRKLDQERMAGDPLLAEEPSEDDLAMAKTLLEQRSAEEVAAALVRVYRSRLPAPEDVTDPGTQPPRRPRNDYEANPQGRDWARGGEAGRAGPQGGPPASSGGGTWFRMNIGRRNNADPRWLLPMLCRRGGVGKGDIGAIRIFDRETKFEVRDGAARQFGEAIRRGENVEPRIEPATEAPARRPRYEDGPGRGDAPPTSRPRRPRQAEA